MGGGSGGGNTTTTQKADPWSGVQPYLTSAYQQASDLYQPGAGPTPYPNSTAAPINQNQWDAFTQMLNQGGNLASLGNSAQSSVQGLGTSGAAGSGAGLGGATGTAGQLAGMGNAASNQGMAAAQGGINNLNNAANAMNSQGINGSLNAINGLQAAGDFNNNPAFQSALQSAIRPVTQQFNEQVMPAISSGAIDAGQMGGSRQGIAQGIAARGYQDTIGDISANMGNAAYAQGLQAQAQAGQLSNQLVGQASQNYGTAGGLGSNLAGQGLGALSGAGNIYGNLYGQGNTAMGQSAALSPTAQQAQLAQGQMQLGIGNQMQDNAQNQLNSEVQKWNTQQNLPYTMISDYLSLLNGAQGGSTTAQQSGGGSSKAMGALGGAATGAAIGTAFAPGIGTGIGAGAGALYGLFM